MVDGGRGREPARLQPGARVSFGALLLLLLLQSVTSFSRAARRWPPASLLLPRPRAPPLGGLRKRRGRWAADKPRPALRCGRRPRPRDTSGRRAPAAAAPRAGAVSRTRTRVEGEVTRSSPGHRSARSRPRRAGPRAESAAGGAPRRTACRRPWPPSCRCVGPGCWAAAGGGAETGWEAPWERGCRAETGASRASSPSGRTAGWGRAPLPFPGSGPLRVRVRPV